MKIISYNLNGIRSAQRKGFTSWVNATNADILCLQETKATYDDVKMEAYLEMGYEILWFEAEKKGYSGVATLTKLPVDHVQYGIGIEKFDREARLITMSSNDLAILNVYIPTGGTSAERQIFKEEWLFHFGGYLKETIDTFEHVIVCGDFNICHTPLDLHNPKASRMSSGFLDHECSWFEDVLNLGYLDTFRLMNSEPHNYTWWPQGKARGLNLGWRIDYILATRSLENRLKRAANLIHSKHSDHCAILLELDYLSGS